MCAASQERPSFDFVMERSGSGPRVPYNARRIASAPAATSISRRSAGSIETLYTHPNIHIVSFQTGSNSTRSGCALGQHEHDGTLHSLPQTETTIAVGLFRIYRAPGSVAFLSCGSALQPILPKSQCWCLDEAETVFLLQIRRSFFWKFEIPTSDEDFREQSAALREILKMVLQYEKTPCPLPRSFSVALPETPVTMVKKRPWTPKESPPSLGSPANDSPRDFENRKMQLSLLEAGGRRGSYTPVLQNSECIGRGAQNISDYRVDATNSLHLQSKNRRDTTMLARNLSLEMPDAQQIANPSPRADGIYDLPMPRLRPPLPGDGLTPTIQKHAVAFTHNANPDTTTSDDTLISYEDVSPAGFNVTNEAGSEGPLVSYTKPDHLIETGRRSPPIPPLGPANEYAASEDSWHSIESPRTSLSANKPSLSIEEKSAVEGIGLSCRGISMSRQDKVADVDTCSSSPGSPRSLRPPTSLLKEMEPPREVTPLAADNSDVGRGRVAPQGIIGKTYDALLAPPAYLIVLMLNVAAKLSAGEWKGRLFGQDNNDEQIPVHWDFSDGELTD